MRYLLVLFLSFILCQPVYGAFGEGFSGSEKAMRVVKKTLTCDGAVADDPCEFDGANATSTLFTVTGLVRMRVMAVCTTLLDGTTGTIEIGISGTINKFIAQTTGTNIDANEIWQDATPDVAIELDSVTPYVFWLNNGADVIKTVATADITSGVIDFYVIWEPVSTGASVVSA